MAMSSGSGKKATLTEIRMKRILTALVLAILVWARLSAQSYEPYLSEAQVRSSVALLPPPPAEGSIAFQLDKFAHWEYYRLRTTDPERAQQAIADADMEDLDAIYGEAFGMKLTQDNMPETYLLLKRSQECFGSSGSNEAKRYYKRTRPFVYFNSHTLTPDAEHWLRTNYSYPSGHTANYFGLAHILGDLRPDRREALQKRAEEGGISRIIVGAHWASDVAAGKIVAGSVYECLKQDSAFQAQFLKAREEVERLLAVPAAAHRASDEQLLRDWIQTIASDEFGGRKPMTPYEDKTVEYLAGELKQMGLEPAFDGAWFQRFDMISVTARPPKGGFTVKGRKTVTLNSPEDLMVWTARATDKVTLSKAEYVFCGFGIHAPEYGWDDYAGIDVKGKIVIAMVNDPGFYDASLFRGRNMTYYGRWLYKFEEAKRRGAAGCLVLHNTEAASYGWHVCVNGHLEDNLAIYDPETNNGHELAVKGWLHEDGARKLFQAAGMDMDKAVAAAKVPGFQPFSLNVKGDVKLDISYTVNSTRNVGALLRGADNGESAVVINAHWDHLGEGKPDETGDAIYNGAADNASGMAGALLLARKFTELPSAPGCSVLFLFPSSEESGLFGSEYYCAHPVIPMEKTVACLNLESIGPASYSREVEILGGGESNLDLYYEAAAAAQGRCIVYDNDNSDGWFYRSDHYNFVKKGVPSVVLENDVQPQWYHKPSDEYRDDWDLSGTMANLNLVFSVALSLTR